MSIKSATVAVYVKYIYAVTVYNVMHIHLSDADKGYFLVYAWSHASVQ